MSKLPVPNIKLNNGYTIPSLGMGTWHGAGEAEYHQQIRRAVKDAIDIGYRLFEGAAHYVNQVAVGEAIAGKIADGTVIREDLFITSKLQNNKHNPESVEPALKQTLKELQLSYLDLYLVHWPFALKEGDQVWPRDPQTGLCIPGEAHLIDTWGAMEVVCKKGLTKSIGLSNFNSKQIDKILKHATIKPVTNQVECHPYLNQKRLREFCSARGIVITAYSPLGAPARPIRTPGDKEVLDDPQIEEIAQKYGKTKAQILLKYNLQLGNVVIPKSSKKQRLIENIDLFDFILTNEDMEYINSFDCNGRLIRAEHARDIPEYPFHPDVEF